MHTQDNLNMNDVIDTEEPKILQAARSPKKERAEYSEQDVRAQKAANEANIKAQ